MATGYLELNQSWECSDKHPWRTTVFTGSWKGFVPLNCTVPEATEKYPRVLCDMFEREMKVVPKVTVDSGYGMHTFDVRDTGTVC